MSAHLFCVASHVHFTVILRRADFWRFLDNFKNVACSVRR